MMAYMNAEAVEKTLATGQVHYYSRSRRKLWMKGESSGHVQKVREIRFDCDADCLLVSRRAGRGGLPHRPPSPASTGSGPMKRSQTAGEKEVDAAAIYARQDILDALYHVIQERRQGQSEKSYVASLFAKGLDKILSKIGEEATETAVAGKGGIPRT